MNIFTGSLGALVLSLGLTTFSGTAFAHHRDGRPMASHHEGRRAKQPGHEQSPPVAVEVRGRFARTVLTPTGEIGSLMLDNGTIVRVPQTARQSAASITVGTPLIVQGFTFAQRPSMVMHPTVRRADATIVFAAAPRPERADGSGPRIPGQHRRDHGARSERADRGGHQRRENREERLARFAALPAVSAQGPIQAIIAGRQGKPRVLILANGSTLMLSRGMIEALGARALTTGMTVTGSGHGTATPRGTGLLCDQLRLADGTVLQATTR